MQSYFSKDFYVYINKNDFNKEKDQQVLVNHYKKRIKN